ncbi:hypothetical protein Btru_048998 [Bulinus truncatus]|nr:hypothetical protein Btru_048998 [Bulinus truncatus]
MFCSDENDAFKGHLIETNLELVDKAILIVRSALANQIDWSEIWNFVKEAKANGDPVASAIKSLKLDSNQITLSLQDLFSYSAEDEDTSHSKKSKFINVDIDLGLGAYANAKKYFDKKRQAAKKEQKTQEASSKAFKSAEKKTKQMLKDVTTVANINKSRKTYWFEKFLWFISSENYLVIGGHDQQQNEMIVKKYMAPCDIYVHADLHGACSCVIKNPGGSPVPPKTLNEAGTMAICNSAAWESKVVTSAWWVYPHQVSKTAPSGEYLTTGSFMIRGKKNYLPPSYLIYGFGFLFKLEDSSIERHKGERKLRTANDENDDQVDSGKDDVIIDDDGKSDEDDEESVGSHDRPNNEEILENYDLVTEKSSAGAVVLTEVKRDESASVVDTTQRLSLKYDLSDDTDYPDTNIQLDHVKGDNFVLHGTSSQHSSSVDQSDVFFLGDDQPVVLGQKAVRKGKLSAKQRRALKKDNKSNTINTDQETTETDNVETLEPYNTAENESQTKNEDLNLANKKKPDVVQPVKRGQRGKKKKIKEKYADQDEEERRLKMEILASAGSAKVEPKKGKNVKEEFKKGKNIAAPPTVKPETQHGNLKVKFDSPLELGESVKQTNEDNTVELERDLTYIKEDKLADQQISDSDDETEFNVNQDQHILDSLTGIPHPEDELLYAVGVCAPYNSLTNYKFKVKLLPGSTKRGKGKGLT